MSPFCFYEADKQVFIGETYLRVTSLDPSIIVLALHSAPQRKYVFPFYSWLKKYKKYTGI